MTWNVNPLSIFQKNWSDRIDPRSHNFQVTGWFLGCGLDYSLSSCVIPILPNSAFVFILKKLEHRRRRIEYIESMRRHLCATCVNSSYLLDSSSQTIKTLQRTPHRLSNRLCISHVFVSRDKNDIVACCVGPSFIRYVSVSYTTGRSRLGDSYRSETRD